MGDFGEVDFEALFEGSPALFMVLDAELTIVAFSDAYCAATLIQREECVGRHLFEVFPDNPDDDAADGVGNLGSSLALVLRNRKPHTMAVQKYDITNEDGTWERRYWSVSNHPIVGTRGEVRYIIHRAEDVTEYVANETHGAEGGAESEILRRSAELGDANRQLHAASDAKNDFLSRMSHELRTPLSAILGFSELLTLADLEPEKHEWSSVILRAGRHLLDLVNEVLDISRIESGDLAISLEPIAIDGLLTSAYELVEPLARARGVTLHPPTVFTGSGYILADTQRLKQVLVNLLSNAVKYNRDGGDVWVKVDPLYPDQVSIAVTDTGEGVAPEKIDRLFVAFDRLDAASTGVEGTGLGLALSRKLCETMGGSLEAQSVVGEGTTFTIALRRGEPTAVGSAGDQDRSLLEPTEYAVGERSLLYIEDTPTNVRLVEQILRSRPSVKFMPAMLGSLGVDLAREHVPDLILLDLHLPDLNGDQVLAQLRADDRTKDIPVVMLSADATGHAAQPLLDAGAHAYLTKPISVRALLAVVDELLGGILSPDAAAAPPAR